MSLSPNRKYTAIGTTGKAKSNIMHVHISLTNTSASVHKTY